MTPTVQHKQTAPIKLFGHKFIMSLFHRIKLNSGRQYKYNIGNTFLKCQSSLCVVTQSHYVPLYTVNQEAYEVITSELTEWSPTLSITTLLFDFQKVIVGCSKAESCQYVIFSLLSTDHMKGQNQMSHLFHFF